tara:strand:+ start:5720 stop:7162 length:1443 start_codon:yes stop_codon:yes gene_type:complete
MASLLGLTATDDLASHASLSARRKVFYAFPNGSAPMTGLLSMADTDSTDKAEFGWYHKREDDMRVVLGTGTGGNGPLSPTGADAHTGIMTAATSQNVVNNLSYRAQTGVGGGNKLRVNNVILFKNFPTGTGVATVDFQGQVTAVSANYFEFRAINNADVTTGTVDGRSGTVDVNNNTARWGGTASTLNVTTDVGGTAGEHPAALIVGSANPEGGSSQSGTWSTPELTSNYTQIFKTPFSSTGTSLQEGMIWSDTGHYKDKAWEAMRTHAKEIELAVIFGIKTKSNVTHDGLSTPQRTTNGVLNFLREWDNSKSATLNTDSNKRYLTSVGNIAWSDFEDYMGRLFTVSNDKNFEKICFCGSEFLQNINRLLYKQAPLRIQTSFMGDEKFKFRVAEVTTMHGTVYFHTHPLFTQTTEFKNAGLFLDINNLKIRPLNNRDTHVQENIQANDVDYRKDQYFSELGLENILPESHLYMDGITGVA